MKTLFKFATIILLFAFFFPTKAEAVTCEVSIDDATEEVIIQINDPLNKSKNMYYMVGVFPKDCKSFNAGETKFFCRNEEVNNPKSPGADSTTAHIRVSAFHQGEYFFLIYWWPGGYKTPRGRCTQTDKSVLLGQCYFEGLKYDNRAHPCDYVGGCEANEVCSPMRDEDECCEIIEPAKGCSVTYDPDLCCLEGYIPTVYRIMGTTGFLCRCECTKTGGTSYDPCENLPDRHPDSEQRKCYECHVADGTWTAIGCIPSQPGKFVAILVRLGFGIGGGIAFLFMIVGAFKILTSEGNPETINAGRQMIVNAIAGLVLIVFSIIVLKIIGVDVLQLPGFVSP